MAKLLKKPKIDEGDFYEVINKAMVANRHIDFLTNTLKEYEDYKKFFNKAFTEEKGADGVYQFRVAYQRKHPVWRDIDILATQTLEDLAATIVDSMGWNNDHMHGFAFPEKLGKLAMDFYRSPYIIYSAGWEDDPYPTFKTNQVLVALVNFDLYPKLKFVFDFGDDHLFDITLRSLRQRMRGETKQTLPALVDQRGVAPEQYPLYEIEGGGHDGHNSAWFSDDCPLCCDLKESGATLQWFPDDLPEKKAVN